MNKYVYFFALMIILLVPLSCAEIPKKVEKKRPLIVKKKPVKPKAVERKKIIVPGEPKIIIGKKIVKPAEPVIPEEKDIIRPVEPVIPKEKDIVRPVEPVIPKEKDIVRPVEPVIPKEKDIVRPVEPVIPEETIKKPEPEITEKIIEPEKKVIPELSIILPTYFNEKDGSDMAYIPDGYFTMGNNEGENNERPVLQVYVPGFYIDIYEITNTQYKMNNDEYESSNSEDCGLCPVSGITWEEATSYCKWAGKRLPAEAEWEKAARGSQQLKWPWGNSPHKNKANVLEIPNSPFGEESNSRPAPIGSFPQGASVFGVLDMAGNVWEWTMDLYLHYEDNMSFDIRYQNRYRVLRGGSWKNIIDNARTTYRHPVPENTRLPNIGFRCVKDGNQQSPEANITD